jgi:predicted nucleic acid-binding Zn ribbon protein
VTRADSSLFRIADVLPQVLKAAGIHEQVQRASVVDEWRERVGATIARIASPRVVSGTVLIVEVRSSAWLNELNMMKQEILRRLNENRNEGRIDGLRFVLSEGVTSPRSGTPTRLRGAE